MLGTGVALGNTVPCPGGQDVAVLCTGKNPGEYASQGSDTINGSELKDLGRGQGGDDFVFGNGDADHGYGDAGDDRVSGGAGNDDMSGFEGEDGLQGGDGVDELDGGGCLNNLDGDAGDDRVFGGTQRDVLAGGLLDSVEGTEVVGEASDGDEAVRLAGELGPDVILMDLSMPNKNGVEATREILAGDPDTGILVVTMLEDDDSVFAAMRAGALGYLLKGARQEGVLCALSGPSPTGKPSLAPASPAG
jgi:CheY-like chemotaxis protein